MKFKFYKTDIEKLNEYFCYTLDYLILTEKIKIDNIFSKSEEKFLWLNIGFNRMKDMLIAPIRDYGWYEKIKCDIYYYFNDCKNKPDENIKNKHNEYIRLIPFINDLYNNDNNELNLNFKLNVIEFFKQEGNENFDFNSKKLPEAIENARIKFNSYNEFKNICNILKDDDAGKELINKMVQVGYYKAFGHEYLKEFLLNKSNWSILNDSAKKKLIESTLKIIFFLNKEELEAIYDIINLHANNYYREFADRVNKIFKEQNYNIYLALNNFDVNNYKNILNYINSSGILEKPKYIYVENENELLKLNEIIFRDIVDKIIDEIEKKERNEEKLKKVNEYDLWDEELFKLLWFICAIGFKREYFRAKNRINV